jgi:hypothetical protein
MLDSHRQLVKVALGNSGLQIGWGSELAQSTFNGAFPGDNGANENVVVWIGDCLARCDGQQIRVVKATTAKRACPAAVS